MSKTSEYWRRRYAFMNTLGKRTDGQISAFAKQVYRNTFEGIKKEIEAFYGRYALNNDISLSDVRKLLDPAELKAAKKEIARYYAAIDNLLKEAETEATAEVLQKYKKQLRLQSAKAYMSRLEDLKARLRDYVIRLGTAEDKAFTDVLQDSCKYTYEKSSDILSEYMGFTNAPSENQLKKILNSRWLGENYSGRVWENKRLLENSLEKTFLQGVIRGQNPREIATEMQKDMGGAYYRCERLARTETIHMLNEAALQTYKDYGVKQYEFIVSEDERTCEICGSLDGEVFDINEKMEGINYPVMHPNCRCSTVPYFVE